jgi:hypothetical protein
MNHTPSLRLENCGVCAGGAASLFQMLQPLPDAQAAVRAALGAFVSRPAMTVGGEGISQA